MSTGKAWDLGCARARVLARSGRGTLREIPKRDRTSISGPRSTTSSSCRSKFRNPCKSGPPRCAVHAMRIVSPLTGCVQSAGGLQSQSMY
eukprot:174640-Rhodomonas_salina.2